MTDEQNKIPEELKSNVGFLLNKAGRLLRDEITTGLKPLSLTFQEYIILRAASAMPSATQQTIGNRLDIDRSSMVDLVDKLEARELLNRVRNKEDRRSYQLLLTLKGQRTLDAARRLVKKVHKNFLEPLDDSEWEVIQIGLIKLINRWSSPE
jgi:DNA-binding MarR family transcriptional regulator